jgi:hypothetical protein
MSSRQHADDLNCHGKKLDRMLIHAKLLKAEHVIVIDSSAAELLRR